MWAISSVPPALGSPHSRKRTCVNMLSRRSVLAGGISLVFAEPIRKWDKKGVILKPGFAGTRSSDLLSAPSVVKLDNGRLRLYFWARGNSHCYIYAAEASPENPTRVESCKASTDVDPNSDRNDEQHRSGVPVCCSSG